MLAPFSSWGATIIGIMAPLLAASALTHSDVMAFLGAAAMNYYAIITVLMVWVTVILHVEIGPMRAEERRAISEGRTFNPDETIPGELAEDLPVHHPGAKRALVIPFALLVAGVLGGIAWTGWRESGSSDLLEIFASTDVSTALLWGGVLGLLAALYYYLRYTSPNPRFSLGTLVQGFWAGITSMLPAISILLLAWMLGDLIGQLGTGKYLGSLVEAAAMPPTWLIPLMFLIAGAMAFSTGTSWGSFGLLLPIAGQIMANVQGGDELLLASFGAVLAGAVFGDHCSPISDTTILSSTGSGANVITHVTTQLPYALISAAIALVGYVVFALTGSGLLGLATALAGLAVFAVAVRLTMTPLEQEIPQEQQADHA